MRFVYGADHAARTVEPAAVRGRRPPGPGGRGGQPVSVPGCLTGLPRPRPATWVAEAAGASRDGAARAPAPARAAGPAVAAAALPLADGLTLAAVAAAAALAGWPADRWLGSGRAGGGWPAAAGQGAGCSRDT